MKKNYKSVSYEKTAAGFALLVDEKPALTPMNLPVIVPSEALAQALVQEWEVRRQEAGGRRQGSGFRSQEALPLTQIACVAIDLVQPKREAVLEEMLEYAQTDLVCYRAGHIPALQARQAERLNPVIEWAAARFGVTLRVTDGLMPVAQPADNKAKLKDVLLCYDDFTLAVLAVITKPLGSLVLALALCEKHISGQQAFELSTLEEAFETQQWTADAEKEAKLEGILQEALAAERFLGLVVS